jgi:hypothetical protein
LTTDAQARPPLSNRRRMELALALCWLIYAAWFAHRAYSDYRMAESAGNLAIGSFSAWRQLIPAEFALVVLITLVAVMAFIGLGVFPLAVGGALLFAGNGVVFLLPCHGPGCGGGNFNYLVPSFGVILGAGSFAFALKKPES